MKKEVVITELLKGHLEIYLDLLLEDVEKYRNSSPNSSDKSAPSDMRKHDLDYCNNVEVPLSKTTKQRYIRCLNNLLLEFLSAKELPDFRRHRWVMHLGIVYCKINTKTVMTWIRSARNKSLPKIKV